MSMQALSLETVAVGSSIRHAANNDPFEVQTFVENFDVLVAAHGGSDQVRALIVELAVRGRLTNAQQGDDDVETLVARIASDVGDRALKYSAVEAASEPFSIPAHWKWVRWGHLSTGTSSGWSPKCENRPRGNNEWGVLKVSAVSWGRFKREENKALPKGVEPRQEFAARLGDFLMSRANTSELVGRCVIVEEQPERLLLSDKIVRCEFSPHVEKGYVALYNRSSSARTHYVTHASGTSDSMKNISRDVILGMPVPLPPLAEQKRIIAKVDQLMALCDDLEARQIKKREVGTRLTKSALEALTTAEGPEEFEVAWKRVVQNFDVLIDRADKVGELRGAVLSTALRGGLCSAEGGDALSELGREGVETVPANEWPHVLPRHWAWLYLEDVFGSITDGDHQPPPKATVGVPFLTIGNVSRGQVDFSDTRFVPRAYFDSLDSRRVPRRGDILYTVVGATYGRAIKVDVDQEFCVQRHIAIMRPDGSLETDYLHLFLRSPLAYRQATGAITGTAQPTVPLRPLRRFKTPVPPLAEQRSVVVRVERFMRLCDELEAKLRLAEDTAGKLVEAVVSELVA